MLALNVSAEIINAFFMLDKGINANNKIVEKSVENTIASMEETAKTKTQYQPLVDKAKEVKNITKGFDTYISDMRQRMVEESGGAYTAEEAEKSGHPELAGKPIGKKDKDTPQRIFVSGDYGSEKKEPQGEVLDAKVQELRKQYIQFVDGLWEGEGIKGTVFADKSKKEAVLAKLETELTLSSSEGYDQASHEGKSWSEFTFGHMPVAAIYPMLRKFQNDAKTSEAAVVSFLASQIGQMELTYDKFAVFSQSSKPYIMLGETYEAEIALGAYSSQADFSVNVNGSRLSVVDGKAKYTARGSRVGEQKYTAKISVKNPLTGETETFSEDFFFEVGQPSVNVAADKMNVFYVGVDNPVTIAAAGVKTADMKASISGGTMSGSGSNRVVRAKAPGKATITVRDAANGKSFPFEFRVKRIPDPVAQLGSNEGGSIGNGTFKAQLGVIANLKNFDFEARCKIAGFQLVRVAPRQDGQRATNGGGSFTGKAKNLVNLAKPGDTYYFEDVKAKCPGDRAVRRINDMVFRIN